MQAAPSRRVTPSDATVAALRELDVPFPEAPLSPEEVVERLDRIGSPATVTTTGGRYYGFVNGGALPATTAASWLVAAWNQNVALRVMSPAGAAFEDAALKWVVDALGLPAGCGGAAVTGATLANMTGLAAARHALLARAGWDVERDGLFGAPPLTVDRGQRSPRVAAEGAQLAGPRPRPRPPRAGRRSGAHARGRAAAARWPDDRVRPGRQRELGRLRSGSPHLHARARRRRLGPRGRRVRHLGGGLASLSPPHRRVRARRFVGHRRAQVAQRRL